MFPVCQRQDVLFSYTNDDSQHEVKQRPEVTIVETLGDVDDLSAFNAYRVYYSGMKMSSSWRKELTQIATNMVLGKMIITEVLPRCLR